MPDRVKDRDGAIALAREIVAAKCVYLDTETTGTVDPQACSIGMVWNNGADVWESLVKPKKAIEVGASAVHGMTDAELVSAPGFDIVVIGLLDVLGARPVVIYNSQYDLCVLTNSAKSCGLDTFKLSNKVYDAMPLYSAFRGEWNARYGNYRWHKLGDALKHCNLVPTGKLHGAAVDAYMTMKLVEYVAAQTLSTDGAMVQEAFNV